MKIGLGDISKLIEDCKKVGFDVKMSDIIYALCVDDFKDKSIPYKTLFDKNATDKEVKAYNRNKYSKFLKKYIDTNFLQKEVIYDIDDKKDSQKYADLSFEENKDAMIKMIDELKNAYDEGKIEYKDYSDRVSKLRIALNDKFKVAENQDDQKIIVYSNYDTICPYCHHEVRSKSAEDAIEEIKKIYELVPKVKKEEDYDERENETED